MLTHATTEGLTRGRQMQSPTFKNLYCKRPLQGDDEPIHMQADELSIKLFIEP